MKKIFIIVISTLFNLYSSQDIRGWNKPTSPEAEMIKKVGDIPVGYYTGVLNVPINLYTIKEGNISLPITLEYSTSGIKVDEQATWVGLGWNLAPEGTITQEVRGIRDQYDDVYKSATLPAGYNAFYQRIASYAGGTSNYKVVPQEGLAGWTHCSLSTSCGPSGNGPNDDSDFVVLGLTNGSGQPDIYHFNFAGYSGSFFINPVTKIPVQLDKKDDIKFIVQNTNIKAITSDGTIFTFSDLEVIDYMGSGANENRNGQNYKLTQILFPNQKQINFEYQNGRYENIFFTQSRNIQIGVENGGGNSTCSGKINYSYQPTVQNTYSSNVKILKSIKTSEVTINFNLEDREDVNLDYAYNGSSTPSIKGTLKKLGSVDIINPFNNKKIKSYKFNYTYFPYIDSGAPTGSNTAFITYNKDVLGKRLKLNSLEAITYDANGSEVHTNNIHSFEYNMQNTLPLKISFAKDFWGYYNAKSNGTLLPNLSSFPVPMDVPSNYQGANRYSDKNFVDAYILKKVTYPTKGSSEFEYEMNTFYNQYVPSEQNIVNYNHFYSFANRGIVGGVPTFTPTDIDVPAPMAVKFYTIFSPGFDGSIVGIGARKYDYTQMLNAHPSAKIYQVIMVNGVETTQLIKSWEFGSMCDYASFNAGNSCDKEEYVSLPQGKIRIILSMDNSMYLPDDTYHLSGVDTKFTINDYSLADGRSSEGHGVRIKSVKNYSSPGILAEWKQYEYQGGILHNKYDPFKRKTYFCYDCGPLTSCSSSDQMPSTDVYEVSDDMADRNFDAVGYSSVTEKIIDVNNGINSVKGTKTYRYHNLENKTSNYFPVRKEEMNGLPIDESIFKADNTNISTKKYYYKNITSENYFHSIDIQNRFLTNGSDPLSSSQGRTKFVYYVTPLISNSFKIDSISTTQNLSNNIIKSKEDFSYNTRGFVLADNIKSGGESTRTEYTYADATANAYLESKNMSGIPLITSIKKILNSGSKTISMTELKYPISNTEAVQKTSGLPLPYSAISYDLQDINTNINPPKSNIDVLYDKYDSQGNLLQYTAKDGVPSTIIWGYNNTQPIAKIEGAKLSDISQSLIDTIVNASNTDAALASNNDETAFLLILDTFRKTASLSNFQITTYTYDPLVGVRSITPPSGIREVYVYDTSNRLKEIRQQEVDSSGNIAYKTVKEFKYNYKN